MRYRMTILAVGVSVTLLSAAACGNSGTPTTTTGAVSPSGSAAASASTGPLTADQVVAKLKAAGLPIGAATDYTAADDPDHLLGRPNGYTSKVSFVDTDIPASQAAGQSGVDLGGEVEVFATAAQATTREQYIQGLESAAPLLGTEYDYTSGGVLLRLSQDLTPTQAQAFAAVLG
jgi:hypothetical protein